MPLPFTYTELLEACPPMLHASHGTMGVIDSHHIVVVGCSDYSSGSYRGFAIMDTSTSEATMYNGALGWRAAEYAGHPYDGRYWVLTTTNDYESSGITVHAIEADGGVYIWDTGIWTNLTVGGNYPGVVILDDWFVLRMSGGTMKGWSMATPTLGSVVLSTSTRPTDTSTGTQVTLAIWNAMSCAKRAGQIYGWCYNNNTLYSVDRTAWTVTPLAVSSYAVAVIAEPEIYVAGKYWSHGTWFDLGTMTGGSVASGGVGDHALASDGYIYSVTSSSTIRCLDPVSGVQNSQTIPSRSERYGVAFLDGHLWVPSGYPYSW